MDHGVIVQFKWSIHGKTPEGHYEGGSKLSGIRPFEFRAGSLEAAQAELSRVLKILEEEMHGNHNR